MPKRKYGPVALRFRPRFFKKRNSGLGSVSRLPGPSNPSKLKNDLSRQNQRTSSPAAIPHKKQERMRTARAVGPSAAL